MINFFYETNIKKLNEDKTSSWIEEVIMSEGKCQGEVNFIFCDDEYLLSLNRKYLNHDTYTDIISFDNSLGNELNGDIFISAERVFENAKTFSVSNAKEMNRVIIHGILHLCGYNDKSEEEAVLMRSKEDEKLLLFHVEQ